MHETLKLYRGITPAKIIGLGLSLSLLLMARPATAQADSVDYPKLRITLSRSACFGSCPDYQVTIRGDGEVEFSTREEPIDPVSGLHRQYSAIRGVQIPGRHHAHVDRAQLDALLQKFRDARFFSLRGEYRAGVTDSPTYMVYIDTGSRSKRIIDYVGRKAGMPKAVTEIEEAIDDVAGSKRWIDATRDVIPLLQAEGVPFNGPIGMQLMLAATKHGDLATMEKLQQLGVPQNADAPLATAARDEQAQAVSWLLSRGAGENQAGLIEALGAAIQSDSQSSYDLLRPKLPLGSVFSTTDVTTWLKQAASNGNAIMTRWLLAQHPEIDRYNHEHVDNTALFEAAKGTCPDDRPKANCDRPAVIKMLLEAGANPRLVRADYRESVLQFVSNPEVARLLLAAGADPNFRGIDDEPVIFSISDEDVALAMIDAGMSLKAVRPADKMRMRGWAKYQKWPRVLALLDKENL